MPAAKVRATVSLDSINKSAVGSTVRMAVSEPAAKVTVLLEGVVSMPV